MGRTFIQKVQHMTVEEVKKVLGFDHLDIAVANIESGTIDGTVIGGTTPATGNFSSVDIDAGTIDGTVIGGTTPATGNFSIVDIDDGSIDGVVIGAANPSTGLFLYIDIDDGLIDGTVIGTGTSATGYFSQARIGTAATYTDIGTDGAITFVGLVRHLAMRPGFVAGLIAKTTKPTSETVGCFSGYSMPVHADDNQELFWRLSVPGRWNGNSDITYYLIACLGSVETVDKTFQMQVSWNATDGVTGAIPATAISVAVIATCTTTHNVQYAAHKLSFTIDFDVITPPLAVGNILSARVRRITSGVTEITTGNVIILDHWLDFVVDKVFKH